MRDLRRPLALTLAMTLAACTSVAPPSEGPIAFPTAETPSAAPVAAAPEAIRCVERAPLPAIEDVVDVRWAPDSSALAIVRYVRVPTRRTVTGYEEQRRLEVVDATTGASRHVSIATHPEWSASGTYLSFWRDENLTKADESLQIMSAGRTVALVESTQPDVRWIGEEMLHWYDNELRLWSAGKVRTVARVATGSTPIFPAVDAAFSADGEHFTLTSFTLGGNPLRFIGVTRTGEVSPLGDAGVAYTEWSPRGSSLLLRSADRVALRAADGTQRIAALASAGVVHGWTAGGRLLLGTVSPTIPGGNALDRFTVFGDERSGATVPNLLGSRAFSPDGRYFAGVSRTGLGSTQLDLYGCSNDVAGAEPRVDTAARARAQRIDDSAQRFIRPVAGAVTQYLDPRWHTGIDIAAPLGSLIFAVDDGVVTATERVTPGGYRVCVMHAAELETCTYHTALALARVGDRVSRGQPIALVGMTGITTGPHVHWEAKLEGKIVDPLTR